MILCLCGAIATGKSTVANVWEEMGAKVIRADLVGHRVLSLPHVKEALREKFGEGIFMEGEVDRKALAERVFFDREALEFLNHLSHPEIKRLIGEEIKSQKGIVVIEAALLFEIGLDEFCHIIVSTYCPKELQRQRLVARGYNPEEAEARMRAQAPPEFCASKAHIIIETSAPIDRVREKAREIFTKIKEGAWVLREAKLK